MQTYFCNQCQNRFSSSRRQQTALAKNLWRDYVFGKQTVKQLSTAHDLDRREVRALLNQYRSPKKEHHPRPVHLLTDAIYFGERKEETSWCVIVARDQEKKEDLAWLFADTETTSAYSLLRERLERLGYVILSVTGDGFPGIKQAFWGIPYQMCQVHMERLVVRGTTLNPQTEAGQVILALVKRIHYTDSQTFNRRLNAYVEKYRDFLNEKTTNSLTGDWFWTHEPVRQATRSLLFHQRQLFTFEQNKNIPKNTNSLEGRFSHINACLGAHRGLSRRHKQRVLNSIFLASTVSPTKKKLNEIL